LEVIKEYRGVVWFIIDLGKICGEEVSSKGSISNWRAEQVDTIDEFFGFFELSEISPHGFF